MKSLKVINLFVAAVLVIVLLVAGIYLQNLYKQDSGHAVTLNVIESCDLGRQSCNAKLKNKSVTLTLQQPVRYLQKIELMLVVDGFETGEITKVLVDFSMPGMQMGINRYTLKPTNIDTVWQGMAIIPVCVSGRKDWQVKLYIDTDKTHYLSNYLLTIGD